MKIFRSVFLAALLLAIGGGVLVVHKSGAKTASPAASRPQTAVPVTAQAAESRDVPVYLTGIGTVQAFNTVVIKSQVNGVLTAIPAAEGKAVKQGDVVAEIDSRPYQAALDQAMAQRAEDIAQLQSAQLDLARYQRLSKMSDAPVQQVDDQRATVNKLVATIQADNAAVETARINLGYCTIRSPIDGRVSFHTLDPGNVIQTASQTGILTIAQDKPISVVFTVPEADLPRIQQAMARGALPVVAYAGDDKTQLAQGTLQTPNNTIDTTTGTIQLKAVFANDKDRLWPGQFVNAHLQVDTLHDAVTVPVAAIQHGPNGLFVYRVQPDNTVQQQPVMVAYQADGLAVVTKGVQAQQTIVVSGQSRLAPGTRVAMSGAGPNG